MSKSRKEYHFTCDPSSHANLGIWIKGNYTTFDPETDQCIDGSDWFLVNYVKHSETISFCTGYKATARQSASLENQYNAWLNNGSLDPMPTFIP